MQRRSPPDAIIGANNRILTGVLEGLHEAGARGRRVAVAGFDGVPLAALLGRPLITAEQPVEEIGRNAARIVIDRLEGRAQGVEKMVLTLGLSKSGSPPHRVDSGSEPP
jgi:LacI family transcriptional regulator